MANIRDFGGPDLLKMAREIADHKGLSFEFVVKVVESAVQTVAHGKYGNCKIRVLIDRKTGYISFFREIKVVDLNDAASISDAINEGYGTVALGDALKTDESVSVGDIVLDKLPPVDLNYASAGVARRKIAQLILAEERKKQYEEFKDKTGMVYGHVDQIEHGNLIININGNEACLPRKSLIGREVFKQGDRVKAAIDYVKQTQVGPQIFLSRVSNDFLIGLFEQEVPEVCDGIVKIHSVARDPGSRAKVAVFSASKNIDPVGACIGLRGNRIKNVTNELSGEKIDVIEYSSDIGTFIVNALAVSEVTKIIIHEELNQIDVVVPESKLNLAIGRRGQNIRLVSMLVGQRVKILTDKEESTRRNKEIADGAMKFAEALDVEEIIGQLLVSEGFASIEDIMLAPLYELTNIEGFSEEIATELQLRAKNYFDDKESKKEKIIADAKMDEWFLLVSDFSASDLLALSSADIRNLHDFAGLSVDEFFEISPDSLIERGRIGAIILDVRKNLGWL